MGFITTVTFPRFSVKMSNTAFCVIIINVKICWGLLVTVLPPWRNLSDCRADSYQLPVSSQDLKTCTAWRQKGKKRVVNKRFNKRQGESSRSECFLQHHTDICCWERKEKKIDWEMNHRHRSYDKKKTVSYLLTCDWNPCCNSNTNNQTNKKIEWGKVKERSEGRNTSRQWAPHYY